MPLVVIRHLQGCRPVTHCVIVESSESDIDDQENYMLHHAIESIDTFKKEFPEFKDADFYTDIIPLDKVK